MSPVLMLFKHFPDEEYLITIFKICPVLPVTS